MNAHPSAGSAPEAAVRALGPLRTMLEADGYSLEIFGNDDGLELAVLAGEACGECLAPRGILTSMAEQMLSGAGVTEPFVLRYPDSHVDA